MAYNLILRSANFTRPSDSGKFIPNNPEGSGTRTAPVIPITAAKIAAQKFAYDKQTRVYNELQPIKIALRNQAIEAIDAEYLEPLLNDTTDMINDSILVIFAFLRANYEHITPR